MGFVLQFRQHACFFIKGINRSGQRGKTSRQGTIRAFEAVRYDLAIVG
jgi:hypothetical protein